jgi:putative ABC transport system permease protein
MWRDLKVALRMMGRERLLSAVVVVTAALGIGGSTAVFSVVSAVLIRDLPYSNAGQLYVMRALAPDGLPGNVTRREFAPIYERENHPTVETASIAWSQASQIVGSDRRPHPTVRYGVTDRFFDVFGVRMALGRGFQPGEQLGRIVISHRVWRDVFGSDADIIGKTVAAEGQSLQVVGVTPADFEFPQDPGFWYLMRLGAGFDKVRAYRGFMRLRPGRTQEQIDGDLRRLAADLGADPVTNQTPVLVAQPMLEYVVGDLKVTVLILFGATGILLLIACINVTNLLLSRTAARSREVALREAIGAGRWRIVYQLLAESVVLVTIGGALGLMVSASGSRILLALAPEGLPRLDSLPMDGTVLLFAAGLTLATGVLVGLAPAWRLARNQLRSLMNEAGRGSSGGPASTRLFSALVVTEIALAVVLMIGAGLLIRSFVNLTTGDPGFNPHGVLTFSMNVPGRVQMEVVQSAQGKPERRPTYAPMAAFFRDLEERIGTISSVESLATTTSLPLVAGPGGIVVVFTLPGQSGTHGDAAWTTTIQAVSPEFFQTMKMHLVSGRDLSRSDRQGSSGAAVVSETFARQFFAGQNPLGPADSLERQPLCSDGYGIPVRPPHGGRGRGGRGGRGCEVSVSGQAAGADDLHVERTVYFPAPSRRCSYVPRQAGESRACHQARAGLDRCAAGRSVRWVRFPHPHVDCARTIRDDATRRVRVRRDALGGGRCLRTDVIFGRATDRRDCRPIGDGGVCDADHETRDGTRNGSCCPGRRSGSHRSRGAATGRRQRAVRCESARPVCVSSRHNGSVWGRRGRLFPPGAASHEDRSRELVEKRVSGDDAFAIEREACVRCRRHRDQACHCAASIFDVA